MKIVQVFKTDVHNRSSAIQIVGFLQRHFTRYKINFDLDDCDNILRIESPDGAIPATDIQRLIAAFGYHCEPLQD